MFKSTLSTTNFALLTFIFCLFESDGRVIYIGSCPLVIGGECDSTLVRFYLYTRSNPKNAVYVDFQEDGNDNLTSSPYDWKLGNKVIIHGYNSDMNLDVIQNLKDEYLNSKDLNIWVADYPNLASSPCYVFAVYNIKYVGRCTASVVQRLRSTTPKELDIHIVGFSLGAQVTNYMAQYLPFQVPRITGLDPALPLFYTSVLSRKLDPSDARFVDVIHTNAWFQGQIFPCGHVDFYVNGGVFQPGCNGSDRFGCYHSRAVEYFAESINSEVGFWGWQCDSFLHFMEYRCDAKEPLQIMGEYADPSFPGVFQVRTAASSPYAKGKDILHYSDGDVGNETRPDYRTAKVMMSSLDWAPYYKNSNNIIDY